MNRPYVICHMTTSIDGKVTGEFLSRPNHGGASELYYQINRDYKADAYACGRVTMEGSFTGGWYPDLSGFEPVYSPIDYLVDELTGFYAVAFDRTADWAGSPTALSMWMRIPAMTRPRSSRFSPTMWTRVI